MKDFYKLYIGEPVYEGLPKNAVSYGIVSRETLPARVRQLAKELQEGQDLYIVNKSIQAYKRDRLEKILG